MFLRTDSKTWWLQRFAWNSIQRSFRNSSKDFFRHSIRDSSFNSYYKAFAAYLRTLAAITLWRTPRKFELIKRFCRSFLSGFFFRSFSPRFHPKFCWVCSYSSSWDFLGVPSAIYESCCWVPTSISTNTSNRCFSRGLFRSISRDFYQSFFFPNVHPFFTGFLPKVPPMFLRFLFQEFLLVRDGSSEISLWIYARFLQKFCFGISAWEFLRITLEVSAGISLRSFRISCCYL